MTAKDRKERPLFSGVLRYFPDALLEVAYCSWKGNEQHNPGQPLHWAKEKSTDEPDSLMRHLTEAGTYDTDGVRHSAKVAWRALALLQREIEAEREQIVEDAVHEVRQAEVAAQLLQKKKAPVSEEKRAFGERLGTWVPGVKPVADQAAVRALVDPAVWGQWVGEGGEPASVPPPVSTPPARRFDPDTEPHPSLGYALPRVSPPPRPDAAANPASQPPPGRVVYRPESTPSHPSSHHASEPGPDGYSEGLGDA